MYRQLLSNIRFQWYACTLNKNRKVLEMEFSRHLLVQLGRQPTPPAGEESIDDRVTGAAVGSWHLLDRMEKDEPLSWQLDEPGSVLSHNPLLIKNLSQLIKCPRLITNPRGVNISTVAGHPLKKRRQLLELQLNLATTMSFRPFGCEYTWVKRAKLNL